MNANLHKPCGRKIKSPEEGQKELLAYANNWSTYLGVHSVHAVYAVIAANWAVHSSPNAILTNTCAVLSIGVCILFISLNLMLTYIMTGLLKKRWQKAEDYPNWWNKEWENQAETRWPFTLAIEKFGAYLRLLKAAAPILAGILFLFSLVPLGASPTEGDILSPSGL